MSPSSVEIALSLLREGRTSDAVDLMTQELWDVTERYGVDCPEWASAQCDLGTVLVAATRFDWAVDCFSHAVSVSPRDDRALRAQLIYRLHLGHALRRSGRTGEAEAQLRYGVEERLAFYGRDHAGYALGLEPLADLLRCQGRPGEARPVVDEAAANLTRNRHEALAGVLALRAMIVLADGSGDPPFEPLDHLPDTVVEQVGRATLQLRDRQDAASAPLLRATAAALEQRLGPGHRATLSVLADAG